MTHTSATKKLRTGYTTGSAASAAAKAGVLFLLHGDHPPQVSIPLPVPGRLTIPIERLERIPQEANSVRVTVLKDGGDDPDATHGHEIQVVTSLMKDSRPLEITLEGGKGVGRATLPGLPVAVGEAAINPAPRAQILAAAYEAAKDFRGTITLRIEVPQGEAIAKKTMNPRLGIVDGISILGTQGIVKPYSHGAYRAAIAEALDVARAAGLHRAVFTTGRRTERLYQESHPDMNPLSIIQAADFFAYSCRAAAKRGCTHISWALYFGKLVKQAQGLEYTHAKTHPVDFDALAGHCAKAGVSPALLPDIAAANTARQVLDMVTDTTQRTRLLHILTTLACSHAARFAAEVVDAPIQTSCIVFDFDGRQMA